MVRQGRKSRTKKVHVQVEIEMQRKEEQRSKREREEEHKSASHPTVQPEQIRRTFKLSISYNHNHTEGVVDSLLSSAPSLRPASESKSSIPRKGVVVAV